MMEPSISSFYVFLQPTNWHHHAATDKGCRGEGEKVCPQSTFVLFTSLRLQRQGWVTLKWNQKRIRTSGGYLSLFLSPYKRWMKCLHLRPLYENEAKLFWLLCRPIELLTPFGARVYSLVMMEWREILRTCRYTCLTNRGSVSAVNHDVSNSFYSIK